MSKFITNLTQSEAGIKAQRALLMAKEASDEQVDLIRGLERQKRELENKMLNLTDLSPDNAFDLRPGGKNYNAKNWVKQMQDIQVEILNLDIQLRVANATMNEWFIDESPKA